MPLKRPIRHTPSHRFDADPYSLNLPAGQSLQPMRSFVLYRPGAQRPSHPAFVAPVLVPKWLAMHCLHST